MEEQAIKCFKDSHEKIDAIIYCQECNIYMCNKCKQSHSDLFGFHNLHNLNENIKDIFTGLCKEKNHSVDLEYYCKTHNKLCCAKCISKFKINGSGTHGNCDVCIIDDIKNEKKNKLNDNIKIMEGFSKNIQESINELKKIFEKSNLDKESLIIKIQKIFTQLRNKLNKREDEIIARVNNLMDRYYINEKIIKKNVNLPNEVKKLYEKGQKAYKEWNDNNLSSLVNDSINIENMIKKIKSINNKINRFNTKKKNIKFYENDDDIYFNIGSFGSICHKNNKFKYSFRESPLNIPENKKYVIYGENQNFVKKVGNNSWVGIICEKKLSNRKMNCWKIKIENHTIQKSILVGVVNDDFDINKSTYENNGWFICLCCGKLFSGPPHNYKNKEISNKNFDLDIDDNIILVMNIDKKSLSILSESKKLEIISDIPVDKPLFPAVFLRNKDDTIEINDYYHEYKDIIKKDQKDEELNKKPEEAK